MASFEADAAAREADASPRRRVGVLGGTFDPIHLGHLILAEETRVALQLDRVVFVPAAQPWRKAGRRIASPLDRLAMVRLATADNPCFEVSSAEVDRGGPTYTAETLEALRAAAPDHLIWFILGADALLDLPNWKDPERILACARLAVAARDVPPAEVLAQVEERVPGVLARTDIIRMPPLGISSSALRRRLRDGASTRYWLPCAVRRYAVDQRLYAAAGAESPSADMQIGSSANRAGPDPAGCRSAAGCGTTR